MKKKILFIFSLLFGLMFINAGLNMFFHYMPMPKDMPEKMVTLMKNFVGIGWLMPLLTIPAILTHHSGAS
jgi:putative oxidoreductase